MTFRMTYHGVVAWQNSAIANIPFPVKRDLIWLNCSSHWYKNKNFCAKCNFTSAHIQHRGLSILINVNANFTRPKKMYRYCNYYCFKQASIQFLAQYRLLFHTHVSLLSLHFWDLLPLIQISKAPSHFHFIHLA